MGSINNWKDLFEVILQNKEDTNKNKKLILDN